MVLPFTDMNGLNDKTVVLVGPFGQLQQNLITRITEHGSDVAVITDDVKSAQRVCQNIMDMREVSEKFGRAAALELSIKDLKSTENTFSQSAEIFGGTDIYIDTHLYSLNIPFFTSDKIGNIDSEFNSAFAKIKMMTQTAAAFLKARTRGRIIYLFNQLDMWAADKAQSDVYVDFIEYVRTTGLDLAGQNTAVNALAIGVSEDYLLSRFGKAMTIQKSMLKLQESIPHAKMVDYNEIANMTSFIASPLSSGLSGQVIRFDHCL